MKYTFDWKDIVHGQIEIEADNGVEAERMFRNMTIEQRLKLSDTGADKDTLEIKFVDIGFGDIQTPEEWLDAITKREGMWITELELEAYYNREKSRYGSTHQPLKDGRFGEKLGSGRTRKTES